MRRKHQQDEYRQRLSLHRGLRRKALVAAIGGSLTLAFAGGVYAQAVNGTINGTVPAVSNEAVHIGNDAGYNRTVAVGANGKYSVILPAGTYTVSLLHNGQLVKSKTDVTAVAAATVTVDFTSTAVNATQLTAITVSASAIPAIDVHATREATTLTAEQLQRLPVGRNATSIALLSPGVQPQQTILIGGPLGTSMASFGGATMAENAYYVDGMNTTFALNNQGALLLPFGVIAQQRTFISGYGAKYGRSIGGVISQIGKSGGNQWHFGVRGVWQLPEWRSDARNRYWANPYWQQKGQQPGDLYQLKSQNRLMRHVYDAHVSGPIIKNRLFFYVAMEKWKERYFHVDRKLSSTASRERIHHPKTYVKLNWNINSSNFMTLTGTQSANKYWIKNYDYDYSRFKPGDFINIPQLQKTRLTMWVANFTSYVTDNLTIHAMYGEQHARLFSFQPAFPGLDPTLAYVSGLAQQNPKYTPNGPVRSLQPNETQSNPHHKTSVINYRINVDYRLGNHEFEFGIDNLQSWDLGDGSVPTGPGYFWIYGHTAPDAPIFPSASPSIPPYVAPPSTYPAGADGYYVQKHIDSSNANLRVTQRAQYFIDKWQVTPRLLLNLGIRNDTFTNYSASGPAFIRLTKPEWSPRLGFSWDVFGDSTFKVFGNAGRYYLAIPLTTATSIANPYINAGLYGTYTGIDQQTGAPIGFKPLPQNPKTGVSLDSAYGEPLNPGGSVAANIKPEYSDNFVLGMQKAFQWLGSKWVFSASGTYQKLTRIIDDYDDEQLECAAGRRQGLSWLTPEACSQYTQSLVLINPGETNIIRVLDPEGNLVPMKFTRKDQGLEQFNVPGPRRTYYAIDLSLTHVWDGKWFGKIDYVFSKLYGNEEGPVSAIYGQSGSYESITAAWDWPERMQYSNGELPNSRRHALKAYGYYQLNPDWTIGGSVYIASGQPRLCLGQYGPDQVALHGSISYHWCKGKPAPPGSLGHMPWRHNVNLNVRYSPTWMKHRLRIKFTIFNVLNDQTPNFYDAYFEATFSPNPEWAQIETRTAPRRMMLTVSYNY